MRYITICSLVAATLLSACSRQSAKDRAKKMAQKGTEVVEVVGEQLTKTGNRAGKALGEGLGAFFSGVGEGVEKNVTTRDVRVSKELEAKGISITVTKHTSGRAATQWQHSLSLYVVNKEPLVGTLRLKLFNESDQEIGRTEADVDLPADDAKYIQFKLDKEVPFLMTKYVALDMKTGAKESQQDAEPDF